jgi:3-methyladenine DNA glycosylase/8-oxoguanine DNA glycosylase
MPIRARPAAAAAAAPPDAAAFIPLATPIELRLTLAPVAHGSGDPTIRIGRHEAWRATRTVDGPATIHLRETDGGVAAVAWGPGAERAIAGAPALVGALDDPTALVPRHALVAQLVHRHPGLRLPRTGGAFEALLPAICEQKVTGAEARAAFRGVVRTYGEPAPGPAGLLVAPEPAVLAAVPYFAFHRFGLERRRADLIRRAAAIAPRLRGLDAAATGRLLRSVPGIGPWTVAEVLRVAHGDPDAVSVGDYHLPNLVAWALAGEPRADDARMLELLEPYRGQRGRVQRLLEASGIRIPRYGPRMAPRDIRGS